MPGKVYLQQINSLTGTPIGKRKILLRDSYGTSIGPQEVLVDPLGKFAIVNFQYKGAIPITYFMRLDVAGNREGHLKKLAVREAGEGSAIEF